MTPRLRLLRELAAHIDALARPHPVRVAIDGVDAAGKTTLADELAVVIGARGGRVIRASLDGFHNPRAVRHRRGPHSPEAYYLDSFDTGALRRVLLEPLGPGGGLRYRTAVYDYRTESLVETAERRAPADAVLLFDGVFLLRPELDGCWDYAVFVDAPFEITLRRAERRDTALFGAPDAVRERYVRRYVPGQRLYLESCRPRDRADAIVDNADARAPTLEIRRPRPEGSSPKGAGE